MGTKASRESPFSQVLTRFQGLTPHVPEAQEARGRCSHGSPWRRGLRDSGAQTHILTHEALQKNGVGSTPL